MLARIHKCTHTHRIALQEEVEQLQRQAADAQALTREVEFWRKRASDAAPLKAEVHIRTYAQAPYGNVLVTCAGSSSVTMYISATMLYNMGLVCFLHSMFRGHPSLNVQGHVIVHTHV